VNRPSYLKRRLRPGVRSFVGLIKGLLVQLVLLTALNTPYPERWNATSCASARPTAAVSPCALARAPTSGAGWCGCHQRSAHGVAGLGQPEQVHPAISTTSGNGSCRPRRVRRCRRRAFTVDRPEPVGCHPLAGTVAHLKPPPVLVTPGLLVVVDGMGPAVASRTPHVDSPPLTLATNRAGGDSATGTGPPAGSRPSAIPEQSSAPCTNVAGLQASPVRVARAARCWSAAVIVVAFGRVLHLCCAPVYATAQSAAWPHDQGQARHGPRWDAIVKGLAGTGGPFGCATQREPTIRKEDNSGVYKHRLVNKVAKCRQPVCGMSRCAPCPPCSQFCWRVTWHQEHCFHVLLAPRCGSSCRRWARWCWLGC